MTALDEGQRWTGKTDGELFPGTFTWPGCEMVVRENNSGILIAAVIRGAKTSGDQVWIGDITIMPQAKFDVTEAASGYRVDQLLTMGWDMSRFKRLP